MNQHSTSANLNVNPAEHDLASVPRTKSAEMRETVVPDAVSSREVVAGHRCQHQAPPSAEEYESHL